jgi:F-type H+-transporting ATPase subunit delta
MSQLVASRYARALVDLVTRPGATVDARVVAAQLETVEQVLQTSPELNQVLLSPAVNASKKRAVLERIGQSAGFSRLVLNFLNVLIDHRRINIFRDVRASFEQQLDERRGVVRVDVTSARPLGAQQQESLTKGLADFTGQQVRSTFAVDEELIGGVVTRIGSTIFDGSVRGQLEGLRRRLVEADV